MSGYAVIAYCREAHSGYRYLKETGAAFCASDNKMLLDILRSIADNQRIVSEYAEREKTLGLRRYQKSVVQRQLLSDFQEAL